MLDFLGGIYCTLIGWFFNPEYCDDLNRRKSFAAKTDLKGYFGGKHKKTRKNLKHKHGKNKTQTNKYFIF